MSNFSVLLDCSYFFLSSFHPSYGKPRACAEDWKQQTGSEKPKIQEKVSPACDALGKSILWESWSFPSSHFLIADAGLVLHLLCSWLAWQTKEQVLLPQEALALLLSWLLMQALSRNALEMGFPSAIPKRAHATAGILSHTKGITGSHIPLEACVPIPATPSSNIDYK